MKRYCKTAAWIAVCASWAAVAAGCVTVNKPEHEREVVVEERHTVRHEPDRRVEVDVHEEHH